MRCKACLANIANNTTIHGVKDLYEAPSSPAKIFWTFVILLMGGGAIFQIWQIFTDYLEPKTGSKVEQYMPEHLPKISVCPKYWANLSSYRAIDHDITNTLSESDIEELDTFMTGHLWYGRFVETGANSSVNKEFAKYKKVAKELLNKYGNSFETFALKHAFESDEIIRDYRFYPPGPKYEITKYASHAGVCYTIEPEGFQTNVVLMDTAFQIIELNAPQIATTRSGKGKSSILIGGKEQNGATGRATRPVLPGKMYSFGLKVHRSITFSKDGSPCVKDGTSYADFGACVIRNVNRNCDRCKYFASSTPRMKEEIYEAPLCHYGMENMYCGQPIPMDIGECKPPCDNEFGEILPLGEVQSTSNGSLIFFTTENYRLNTKYIEYAIYSNSGFFSALGGTISLFFGASIVSMVQVTYMFAFLSRDQNFERSESWY